MNHDEAAKMLGPYRDGELDLATCLKLEEHLAGCPLCQAQMADEEQLTDLIRTEAPRFEPSPFLKTRITATLRAERSPEAALPWWKNLSAIWMYGGLTGAVAAILLVATFLWTPGLSPLAQEAVANHVRSLQATHLMDVASTDQHTVKPWFAGKLDYSPPVVDLKASGYPLIGGRLDVLDHRVVAAIIYQRRKHYINLFIWPADAGSVPARLYNQNGYHVLGWTRSGMNYLAVSELGEGELKDFARMIQAQIADTRPVE